MSVGCFRYTVTNFSHRMKNVTHIYFDGVMACKISSSIICVNRKLLSNVARWAHIRHTITRITRPIAVHTNTHINTKPLSKRTECNEKRAYEAHQTQQAPSTKHPNKRATLWKWHTRDTEIRLPDAGCLLFCCWMLRMLLPDLILTIFRRKICNGVR